MTMVGYSPCINCPSILHRECSRPFDTGHNIVQGSWLGAQGVQPGEVLGRVPRDPAALQTGRVRPLCCVFRLPRPVNPSPAVVLVHLSLGVPELSEVVLVLPTRESAIWPSNPNKAQLSLGAARGLTLKSLTRHPSCPDSCRPEENQ